MPTIEEYPTCTLSEHSRRFARPMVWETVSALCDILGHLQSGRTKRHHPDDLSVRFMFRDQDDAIKAAETIDALAPKAHRHNIHAALPTGLAATRLDYHLEKDEPDHRRWSLLIEDFTPSPELRPRTKADFARWVTSQGSAALVSAQGVPLLIAHAYQKESGLSLESFAADRRYLRKCKGHRYAFEKRGENVLSYLELTKHETIWTDAAGFWYVAGTYPLTPGQCRRHYNTIVYA